MSGRSARLCVGCACAARRERHKSGMLPPRSAPHGEGHWVRYFRETGMRRIFAIAGLLAAVTAAQAQPYPSRPVTMIVPFGAGGPTDALARIVAQRMSVAL